MVFRSAKVIVISLGRCCKHGGGVPQSPDCCSSCNVQGKMREGGVDDGKVWLVMLRVCGAWVGGRCLVPWGEGFLFVWWWLC